MGVSVLADQPERRSSLKAKEGKGEGAAPAQIARPDSLGAGETFTEMSDQFDVVVIGGGPGGYNAAIRAGQLGLSSACIDKRGTFGGTCLNIGCIPSKSLLYTSELYEEAVKDLPKLGVQTSVTLDLPTMMAHKTKVVGELTRGVDFLLKKNKSEAIVGEARIAG